MKTITSKDNPRFKNAIRLKTSRGRKTQQRIIIFGLRELMHAIQSGVQPTEVFLCSESLTGQQVTDLSAGVSSQVDLFDLPPSLIEQLGYGERKVNVVAIAHRPNLQLDRLSGVESTASPLVVVLESIEKPGNIGAVFRSVDGAGADAVILVDPQCDVLHPNCIRASLGSVFSVPLAIATVEETISWCQANGLAICSLSDSGETPWFTVDWCQPVAVALGCESTGLSDRWFQNPCQTVTIPMQGISDSLNVSVAAGVVLYESRRQRSLMDYRT